MFGIAGFFSLILIFYVLYVLIDMEGKRIRKEKNRNVWVFSSMSFNLHSSKIIRHR